MPSRRSNPHVSNLGWLGVAFVIAWVAVCAYVVRLARAQRGINERLDEIERSSRRPSES
jgi:CcmD family protein